MVKTMSECERCRYKYNKSVPDARPIRLRLPEGTETLWVCRACEDQYAQIVEELS